MVLSIYFKDIVFSLIETYRLPPRVNKSSK